MRRNVQPEILDELDASDPRAIQSRRDLQRVNTLMGHPRAIAQALRGAIGGAHLVELGSGDGTLLLTVARRLGMQATPVRAVLVDRRPSVSTETRAAFASSGWHIETAETDVFEWLRRPQAERADVTLANLFLHHFREPELSDLLRRVSEQTKRFVACEPRRSHIALAGTSFLRVAGCNEVTQHDAKISVRAGFRDHDLSALWPAGQGWTLKEWRSGPFTHAFVAAHPGGS